MSTRQGEQGAAGANVRHGGGTHTRVPTIRQEVAAKPGYMHHLFLSRNRSAITRQMVFIVIKKLAEQIGLEKVKISPTPSATPLPHTCSEGGAPFAVIRDMLGHAKYCYYRNLYPH